MKKILFILLIVISSCFQAKNCLAQNATFEITYIGLSAEAQAAFEYATDLWSNYLISDVPIQIVAHMQALLPGQLGITFPNGELNFAGAPENDLWYASCLANAITGIDLNGGDADMEIYFNSFGNFYYGLDQNPAPGQYDFVSTSLHEICHGLGFLSLANTNGAEGSFGIIDASEFSPLTTTFPWPELDTLPSVFDKYLETISGTVLLTLNNPSDELTNEFTSNLIYFNSPIVLEDNLGERGKIYAPGTFTLGSSLSHWDEGFYPVGNDNELMTPQAAPSTANHEPGPLTLALLDEIGWEIIYDTAGNAVNSILSEEIKIYPNPVNDILNIKYDFEIDVVEIYNATGELIELFHQDESISFRDKSQGCYLIKVVGRNGIYSQKILKL